MPVFQPMIATRAMELLCLVRPGSGPMPVTEWDDVQSAQTTGNEFPIRRRSPLPEEREKDVWQARRRATGNDDGSKTIETHIVYCNEQFSGFQNRRALWEQIRTAWVEILFSQRKVYMVHDEVHNFPEIKSWVTAKWLK